MSASAAADEVETVTGQSGPGVYASAPPSGGDKVSDVPRYGLTHVVAATGILTQFSIKPDPKVIRTTSVPTKTLR